MPFSVDLEEAVRAVCSIERDAVGTTGISVMETESVAGIIYKMITCLRSAVGYVQSAEGVVERTVSAMDVG